MTGGAVLIQNRSNVLVECWRRCCTDAGEHQRAGGRANHPLHCRFSSLGLKRLNPSRTALFCVRRWKTTSKRRHYHPPNAAHLFVCGSKTVQFCRPIENDGDLTGGLNSFSGLDHEKVFAIRRNVISRYGCAAELIATL